MNQVRPHVQTGGLAASVLCGVFGLDWHTNVAQLLSKLGQVADLAHQTRSIVQRLPPEASGDVMLRHFPEVEAVVGSFANVGAISMMELCAPMKETGWHSLELASDLLRRYQREPTLDDDTVRRLLKQTRDLKDEVRDAEDLDDDVRSWLIQRLREVEVKLEDVDLNGCVAVEEATDQLFGGLLRRITRIGSHPVAKAAVGLVLALDLALNVAANAKALGPAQDVQPSPVVVQLQNIIENRQTVTFELKGEVLDRPNEHRYPP
jgi:hypothetical protein